MSSLPLCLDCGHEHATDPDNGPDCYECRALIRAGGDGVCLNMDDGPVRTYRVGDRVTVRDRLSSFDGARGIVSRVFGTYEDGYTVYLDLEHYGTGGRGLPFAPSQLDLTEIGDRMFADLGAR